MKVAVVGSGGFIAGHLVKALEDTSVEVISLSSRNGTGLDCVTGLIPDNMSLSGAEVVVYLAQSPHSPRSPETAGHMLRVNIISAVEVAELARQNGAKRFVYASTGNVYRPSFEPLREEDPVGREDWYALSKLQGEQALSLFREYLDIHILRLFGVYGPGQTNRLIPTLIKAVNERRPVYVERNPVDPDDVAGLKVSLCYVEDVVQAMVRLCHSGGPEMMNVAGNEAISIRRAAELIGKAIGIPAIINVSDGFREGDFIANAARFSRFLPTPLTPFTAGIQPTIKSWHSS